MPAPHEVVASPLTMFLGVIGTSFPALADAEDAFDPAWEKLGKEGDANYDEGGVTVSHAEAVYDFTPAGRTMPTKRFRTGETLGVKLNLVDLRPSAYAKVMNDATVTVGAGEESFPLFRGDQVNSFAVLLRGMSALDNDLVAQYEIPIAFVSVNGDVVWDKGKPAMLPVDVLAVVHNADTDTPIYRVQGSEPS